MKYLLIVAHAPLASALRAAALHVFEDAANSILAIDVLANDAPETSLAYIQNALTELQARPEHDGTLVLADIFGATPCNVAMRAVEAQNQAQNPTHPAHQTRLLAGASLPMLLRALGYRAESMDSLITRASAGGVQGVMAVGSRPPQNQNKQQTKHLSDNHDSANHHHQQ